MNPEEKQMKYCSKVLSKADNVLKMKREIEELKRVMESATEDLVKTILEERRLEFISINWSRLGRELGRM